ncbi:MAG: uroporphyrinogen decarboxylase [Deltaproteobacteria bacterium CG_4_8_14_3_um_filter_45_9]|nr:MAG: uroporphyrinogen decarboxylase [Deltaproteobacteria bacterium CG03_land_8_20_14_0_80_45_14]PIX26622.1 MAG: uroporphyrinogen decarboxylase [Deltaproteobacteria bacterium CG_4_8_14_3_um_filter_45_9]
MEESEKEYPFLRACRRQTTDYTPIWLMRQAGRYMKEYRALRKKYSFLEMCKNPELAAKVTLQPIERFKLDAAIIFSDILIPLEPMGVEFEFAKGEGPVFHHPLRGMKDVEKLRVIEPEEETSFLMKAIQIVRKELERKIPLIGFSGAPFTLASYIIEGGHSRNYILTKNLIYQDPNTWDALMEKISVMLIRYLNAQIRSGVQALQLFDSWVGCLTPSDYEEYVLPYSKKVIDGVGKSVPLIHFATSSSTLLELMKRAGGDVIGVDWRVDIREAWARLGHDIAIQGNLDPVILFGPVDLIEKEVKRILDRVEGRPGHIFNLGHGILPNTPVDHVAALVNMVHEFSSK